MEKLAPVNKVIQTVSQQTELTDRPLPLISAKQEQSHEVILASIQKGEIATVTQNVNTQNEKVAEEPVYDKVDQMPEYPGGTNTLMKFLGDNIKYPTDAIQNNISGMVIVQFVVDKVGNIKDINVLRGISTTCDNEALRVVKLMPKWLPGKQKGKNVNVKYILPIRFSMDNNEKDDQIYTTVDQMPEFPGGTNALMKFLGENIKYPADAHQNGISGTVIIQFIVRKTGEIIDINLLRGISNSCDNEAIRVVKIMPKWIPGKQKGKEVNVKYTLPVRFSLQ
ncbi:MAG: TonB family protein [Bacteroidota bacterium]|nr:TonB family protein [Bacteroidota bacterium]